MDRRAYLSSYLASDLLGLKSNHYNVNNNNNNNTKDNKNRNNSVIVYLKPAAPAVTTASNSFYQQSIVRLMNAMASVKIGRDYLGN